MNSELKTQTYQTILDHPTWSDRQIGEHLNVSRSAVWRVRCKIISAVDYELAKKVAGKFLADFQMASDYFKTQIERLEKLKEETKTVYHSTKDGGTFTTEEKLSTLDILAIEKQQKEFAQEIAKQWYMPNFKAIVGGSDTTLFKTFKIEAEFEPLKLEAFDDAVEAVERLNKQFPLLPSAAGELLGLENFEKMIDPDIERPNPNKQGFGFIDSEGKDINLD